MAEVRLTIGAPDGDPPQVRDIRINGDRANFVIGTEPLANWGSAHVPPRLLDLLDIAAAVFAADGFVTRGGLSRPGLGAAWRRTLSFEITVRQPDFWSANPVREALVDALTFLTDDRYDFVFQRNAEPPPSTDYLALEGYSMPPKGEANVVLFSGGLDSLAGALETLDRERGRVILVSHRSAPKIISRQNELFAALKTRYGDRLSHVPVNAHKKGETARDRSQRSRSFLFAALGFVIARIVGVERISFFENGVVSCNLPLSPQIVGTMATRTTHPLALLKFETLLALVGNAPFSVRNEYEWLTKAEVVAKLRDRAATELIETAVSCNQVIKRTVEHMHCGECSQCLDRRFGVLAAGLDEHEADTIYETPVLTGARPELRSNVAAIEWTRHAIEMASMDLMAFQERFGGEVARIAQGYPGTPRGEILKRVADLHRRHGEGVRRVLTLAVTANASAIVDGGLPETSILRRFVSLANAAPALAEVRTHPLDPSMATSPIDWPETEGAADGALSVALSGEGRASRVTVRGLGDVTGMAASPATALKPQHVADRTSGRSAGEYVFVAAGELARLTAQSKPAVAQNVKRCRDRLADLYSDVHGHEPTTPLLIQTRKSKGYRLDPGILIVESPDSRE